MEAFDEAQKAFFKKLPENIAKDIVKQIATRINEKIDNALKDDNFANVITAQINNTIRATPFDELASSIINSSTFKIIAADPNPNDSNLLQKAATIQQSSTPETQYTRSPTETISKKGGTRKAALGTRVVRRGTRKAVRFSKTRPPFKIPRRYTRRYFHRGGVKYGVQNGVQNSVKNSGQNGGNSLTDSLNSAYVQAMNTFMKQLTDVILTPLEEKIKNAITEENIKTAITNAIDGNMKAQFNKEKVAERIRTTVGTSLGNVIEGDDVFKTKMKKALYAKQCEDIKKAAIQCDEAEKEAAEKETENPQQKISRSPSGAL